MWRTMRIAQLLSSGAFAGAEAVACALTSALQPHVEHSVLYLILETRAGRASCDQLVSRARSYGIPLKIFETDRRFSWPLVRQLQAALREDRIDVAHSHSYKSSFWAPLIKKMDADAVGGVFFTLHGVDLPPSLGLLYIGTVNAIGAYQSRCADRLQPPDHSLLPPAAPAPQQNAHHTQRAAPWLHTVTG
jgi:hypothetical protein